MRPPTERSRPTRGWRRSRRARGPRVAKPYQRIDTRLARPIMKVDLQPSDSSFCDTTAPEPSLQGWWCFNGGRRAHTRLPYPPSGQGGVSLRGAKVRDNSREPATWSERSGDPRSAAKGQSRSRLARPKVCRVAKARLLRCARNDKVLFLRDPREAPFRVRACPPPANKKAPERGSWSMRRRLEGCDVESGRDNPDEIPKGTLSGGSLLRRHSIAQEANSVNTCPV